MTMTDRLAGINEGVAVKAPCVVATTANIALTGLLTIDGVTVASGDRVLVKDQDSAIDNGIWTVSSGAWSRALDFNGTRDVVQGSIVYVISGTVNAGRTYNLTTADPVVGTSSLAFAIVEAGAFTDGSIVNADVNASAGIAATKLSFTASGTGGVARTVQAKLDDVVNVLDYGAVGDGVILNDATTSITSGAATLTVVGASFTSADIGKRITVTGAGAAGATLATTIAGYTSATVVTLTANAGTTVTAAAQTVTYGTDDTTVLQAAIDAAMLTGKPIVFPGRRNFCISAKLVVKPKADLTTTDQTPASDVHFTDNMAATLIGYGSPTLNAMASMASMVELIFDTSDSDIGPFYSRIEGLGFFGNSLGTSGIKSDYAMHVSYENNRFKGLTRGIEYTGYGVARIIGNTFRTTIGIYFLAGGGDTLIEGNDFYAASNNSTGVYFGYYGGNTRVISNIFTNEGSYTTTYCVQIVGGTAAASEEIRDCVIFGNEFCGYTTGVRIDGKATGTKNVWSITIRDNHTLPYSSSNPGELLAAVDATDLIIDTNYCNSIRLIDATAPAIEMVRCQRVLIRGNQVSDYEPTPFQFTDCTDVLVEGNRFTDVGKLGASYVNVQFFGASSIRNRVERNIFRQSSASYAQNGVYESAGDYLTALDNVFDTVASPYTLSGSNSLMRRIEYGTSAPGSGKYIAGDIVYRVTPTVGDSIGWVCVTGGTPGTWNEFGVIELVGSATYDPASLNDGVGATTTVTVTGAALGDYAQASFSLDLQGVTLTAWVSATDTVSVRFQNESGGILDLGSGTLRARVTKA